MFDLLCPMVPKLMFSHGGVMTAKVQDDELWPDLGPASRGA
tara:strand:+ start:21492 stop:21614 length:123 start_codon:yes stop_codon:yes gene_type:complete